MRPTILLAVCFCGVAVQGQSYQEPRLQSAVEGMLGSVISGIGNKQQIASTMRMSATGMRDAMLTQYSMLSKQLEQQINAYEQNFCTPGSFTPGRKVPATFTGQSFALTFDSGSCYFNETQYHLTGAKELNCTEPSVTFVSSPANYTSSYHAAASFTSKSCQISKTFGEPMEKVLYVFDGQYNDGEVMDVNSLSAKIAAEVQTLLSGVGTNFQDMGGMTGAFAGGAAGVNVGASSMTAKTSATTTKKGL